MPEPLSDDEEFDFFAPVIIIESTTTVWPGGSVTTRHSDGRVEHMPAPPQDDPPNRNYLHGTM